MANYLGQTFQVTQPTSNVNVPLTNAVLAAKQGAYNSNKSQIEQTIQAFSNLDILRPQDKEYLAAKISDVTNKINTYGNRDLSSSNATSDILGTVQAVANDPIILDAMENTINYRKFQSQVQQVREKKPELYSDVNYSYALANGGVEDYLAGKTNKIGNLQYSNYVDVTSNALKKIKDLKDLKGKQVVEVPDPQNPGQIIKKSIDGLTDQQLFDYIPNILTPEENRQLQINGWSKYAGNLPTAQKNFNSYKTDLISNIDENIANANAIINNSAATEDQKKDAQLSLSSYQKQKEDTQTELSQIDVNNATAIGGFLERNSFKYGIAKLGKSEWSTEYEKDDYYFAKKNLELDLVKEARAQRKDDLEIKKLEKELGTGENPDAITFSAKDAAIAQELNPYTDQVKDFQNVTNEMSDLISTAINSERTTDDIKEHYVSELNKRGYDATGNVIEGKESIARQYPKALAMKQAFDASNAGVIHSDIAKKLAGVEIKRNSLASEVNTAKTGGLTEVFKNQSDKYITTYKSLLNEAVLDSQSDLEEGTAEQLSAIADDARAFIEDNGGFDNIKSVLQKDPRKLSEFSEKLDALYKKPSTITGGAFRFVASILDPVYTGERAAMKNLKEDATVVSNNILRQRTAQNRNISFNTAQVATIGDEGVRKRIVNLFPQTEATALFNTKNPMSFETTPTGDIRITQNSGFTNTSKGGYFNKNADITVSKEDAAFKELQKYVDLNDRQRGLDASTTKVRVKPTIPISFVDGSKKTLLGRADESIQNLSPSVKTAFSANPVWFLTQSRTEQAYNAALKGKVSPEKVSQLVNVMSQNLNKLKPELKPFDGNWALSVSTSTGKSLIEGDTGIKYLEDDWAYLVKTYPQIIVGDGVLRYLTENPSQVDSLINTLQQ